MSSSSLSWTRELSWMGLVFIWVMLLQRRLSMVTHVWMRSRLPATPIMSITTVAFHVCEHSLKTPFLAYISWTIVIYIILNALHFTFVKLYQFISHYYYKSSYKPPFSFHVHNVHCLISLSVKMCYNYFRILNIYCAL